MNTIIPQFRNTSIALCLLIISVLIIFSCGCSQPALTRQTNAPSPITVTQPDNSHILISYSGSPETNNLLELEATVTDSTGKVQTKSVGDRYSTTPLRWGATLTLTGNFNGNDHLVVTGYFMDGSQRPLVDTSL